MTGLYVGQAIGGFGATVAAIFSWHTTFHWFGIVGMIYSVVLIFLLRENPNRMIAEQPVFCGGQREEAVAVWRVEHVVSLLGHSGLSSFILRRQSSGIGPQRTGFPLFSLKVWVFRWRKQGLYLP